MRANSALPVQLPILTTLSVSGDTHFVLFRIFVSIRQGYCTHFLFFGRMSYDQFDALHANVVVGKDECR